LIEYLNMKNLKIIGGILTVVVSVILSCETDGEMEKARRAAQKNSLPTLTTNAVTTFTATTATLGGTITNAGTPAYTERGVCYATTQNPTTVNNKTPVTDSETSNFSAGVTGLTPSTKYYVKAYAIHADGTVYGNEVNFTTSAPSGTLPTLTTNAITAFTATSATLGGNITNAGTPEYSERGVVFYTEQSPTTEHNKTVIVEGPVTGNFSTEVYDLMPNTQYYVRAYAINTAGTAYGNERSFTTSGSKPALTTLEATNISVTGATLGGNIIDTGTPPYTEKGVCYSTSENPTIDHNKTPALGTGTGNFDISVSTLSPKTTYYVRAYAINAEGLAYGEQVSFTTQGILPTLTTNDVTDITTTTAILGGNITNVGITPYTERGAVYATTQNPTVTDMKIEAAGTGSETGNFTVEASGLSPNTTYYVRAYAINSEGPVYGAQVSFTTLGPPVLTTSVVTKIAYTTASLGGNITHVGAPEYSERGVCYATSQSPTIDNNKTIVPGTETGSFSIEVNNLMSNTTYYVRAYTIQSEVPVYGVQVSFTTDIHPGEPVIVSVQGGTFMMGSPEGIGNSSERPQHQITLSDFGIGKYEVTQAQWKAVMDSNPSEFKGDNHPVEMVSWNDIVGTTGESMEINGIRYREDGFIYKLNELTGKNYRLPTEAEWEYVARGGNQSERYLYSGSNNIDVVAWYDGNNSPYGSKPVGTKAPNELGIYDMSGNVFEWCSDWYSDTYYSVSPQNNPMGPSSGSYRVIRGGSWNYDATNCRVANRFYNYSVYRIDDLGFRLVLSL